MAVNKIKARELTDKATRLLETESGLSEDAKNIFTLLLSTLQALLGDVSLNSSNSKKPPASDPNRKKKKKQSSSKRSKGGQPGHSGSQLNPVNNPDIIEELKLDRRTLPRDTYQAAGYESRQVIDFNISIEVTEYRAQVWVNSTGKRYVAAFPAHVKRPVQYGPTVNPNIS